MNRHEEYRSTRGFELDSRNELISRSYVKSRHEEYQSTRGLELDSRTHVEPARGVS